MRYPEAIDSKLKELNVDPTEHIVLVSVSDQKLTLFRGGESIGTYRISTSEKGTGQVENTFQTPLGLHRVSEKIGGSSAAGTIFKAREDTGEVWKSGSDAHQGEDLILTRILRLEGLEEGFNRGRDRRGQLVDSHKRFVYIHGTNREDQLGTPASHGCVRMANADVVDLFDKVPEGTLVLDPTVKLGVNIDHVATLRQARYKDHKKVKPWAEPDLLAAAREVKNAGAHAITVHLREDRRHVQDSDIVLLKRRIGLPLNLELADVAEILRIALKLKPAEACLVPERRQEVTTEGGLDAAGRLQSLRRAVAKLESAGIRTSLFIDPSLRQIEAAFRIGASAVELHTGCFANARTAAARSREFAKLKAAAAFARAGGLQVNAGHGLNYKNVGWMRRIPGLHTLNIGHAIVSRAVFVGLRKAVVEMLRLVC